MNREIDGLIDIHTILSHERKLGGAVEADFIRLNSGEMFQSPVITRIDVTGGNVYTVSFVDESGRKFIVHVNEIAVIGSPGHKRIHELNNRYGKQMLTARKLAYLKRLCEVNAGSSDPFFVKEVIVILDDIGMDAVNEVLHPELLPVIRKTLSAA
ncbi:hypothetical protein [Staphylospora marina]|uniref:hypothetical protein n=1 Tax=Staphylospora marina TaxID=2490858 RepID=UPI000F5B92FB|nr:hypothetical protein [Staphylospora marina]